jgi:putative oxidoreductase
MENQGLSSRIRKINMKLLKKLISGIIYGNNLTAFLRLGLGIVFIYSGVFKVLDPSNFKDVIILYNIVPVLWAPYGAIVIPWIELITGIMLFFGFRVRPASLILVLLMMSFTAFIAVNLASGNIFDCGCLELTRLGLGINENVSIALVIRDLVFTVLLLLIFAAERHLCSVDHFLEKSGLIKMV